MSALDNLPREWRDWLLDNLEKGCGPVDLLFAMVKQGNILEAVALEALKEAAEAKVQSVAPFISRPDIVATSNCIQLDRRIDILLTLNNPRVVLLGNLLDEEECDALVALGVSRLERSQVIGEVDGTNRLDEARTSSGSMFNRGDNDIMTRIESRLAALSNWPVENGEGIQVLRYGEGEEYRAHFDWFDPKIPGPATHLKTGGQRVGTFVLYLSDVESGGGTSFPSVGLVVHPKKGSGVFFADVDEYGIPDPQTLHAGDPVRAGVKIIATKWLRERPFVAEPGERQVYEVTTQS